MKNEMFVAQCKDANLSEFCITNQNLIFKFDNGIDFEVRNLAGFLLGKSDASKLLLEKIKEAKSLHFDPIVDVDVLRIDEMKCHPTADDLWVIFGHAPKTQPSGSTINYSFYFGTKQDLMYSMGLRNKDVPFLLRSIFVFNDLDGSQKKAMSDKLKANLKEAGKKKKINMTAFDNEKHKPINVEESHYSNSRKAKTIDELNSALETDKLIKSAISNDKLIFTFDKSGQLIYPVKSMRDSIDHVLKSVRLNARTFYRRILINEFGLLNIIKEEQINDNLWLLTTHGENSNRVFKLFEGSRIELEAAVTRAVRQQRENHVLFLKAMMGSMILPTVDSCEQRFMVKGITLHIFPNKSPDLYATAVVDGKVMNFKSFEHLVHRFSNRFLR